MQHNTTDFDVPSGYMKQHRFPCDSLLQLYKTNNQMLEVLCYNDDYWSVCYVLTHLQMPSTDSPIALTVKLSHAGIQH